MNNHDSVMRWFKDGGNETLAVNYPLKEDSIVFDVGGYKGDWSAEIVRRYNSYVYIFEPVKKFYEICKERFKDNPKVCVYEYGLSDHTGVGFITPNEDSSTLAACGSEKVVLRDVDEIICSVDLISINAEGEEYPILFRLINNGKIEWYTYIQVQFHDRLFCEESRNNIREHLSKTHVELYNYEFVWEAWKKKEKTQ